jgi:hypothetical protein
MKESRIQDEIRLALGQVIEIVLWRNNIGVADMRKGPNDRGFKVRFGVGGPGGADLIGIFRHRSGLGQFVAAEIKTERGRQTDEQRVFQQLVESKGGIYVVLRSVDEARAWIAKLQETTLNTEAV